MKWARSANSQVGPKEEWHTRDGVGRRRHPRKIDSRRRVTAAHSFLKAGGVAESPAAPVGRATDEIKEEDRSPGGGERAPNRKRWINLSGLHKKLTWVSLVCAVSIRLIQRLTQEAWNEKVLLLSSQDFWLMFPYFRTQRDKMTLILKSSNDSFLRYGNPDMPFLWTLSWKFEFQVN